jgi:hypothetical protein
MLEPIVAPAPKIAIQCQQYFTKPGTDKLTGIAHLPSKLLALLLEFAGSAAGGVSCGRSGLSDFQRHISVVCGLRRQHLRSGLFVQDSDITSWEDSFLVCSLISTTPPYDVLIMRYTGRNLG